MRRGERKSGKFFSGVLCLAVLLGGAGTLQQAWAACVTDDTGAEVCAEEPARIISLYGAYTEILWEIGAGDALVARTKNDDTIPAVAELPSVGTGLRPNVEYLLALRPDLVVSRGSRAASEALGSLRARGLTVAAFDPRGTEELFQTIERLGRLTGTIQGAARLVRRLKADLARVEQVTATVPPGRRQQVVFEVRGNPLTVAGRDGLVNEIIARAGGRNAVGADKKLLHLDVELLLHLDPDAYVVQEGPMNRNPAPPAARPHLANLRSVQEGRVLFVDEQVFSRPGPRVAEAAEQLSRFLYPGLWEGR